MYYNSSNDCGGIEAALNIERMLLNLIEYISNVKSINGVKKQTFIPEPCYYGHNENIQIQVSAFIYDELPKYLRQRLFSKHSSTVLRNLEFTILKHFYNLKLSIFIMVYLEVRWRKRRESPLDRKSGCVGDFHVGI